MTHPTLTGSEILWATLAGEGTTTVFVHPGDAILPIYDALRKFPTIHHILVRNEQGPPTWATAMRAAAAAPANAARNSTSTRRSSPSTPLEQIGDPKAEVTFRVEHMKLNKDKSELRLQRLAHPARHTLRRLRRPPLQPLPLEGVIDQYRVSTDARSCIVDDPTARMTLSPSSVSSAKSSPFLSKQWKLSVDFHLSILIEAVLDGLSVALLASVRRGDELTATYEARLQS